MKPYRTGKIQEFRKGEVFVNRVEWEDGRVEIELHECSPRLLFRSYAEEDLEKILKMMDQKSVNQLVRDNRSLLTKDEEESCRTETDL